jgi:hypothetical protein
MLASTPMTADWILVRSEARHETLAAQCIRRYCELDYYIPKFWNRSACAVQLLFPSLIFVQVFDGRFHFLRSIPWVRSIMMHGEGPARATSAVEALKQRENKNGLVTIPYFRFRFAAPVRVTAGPFIGQLGYFHHLKGYDRALVLLEALGMVNLHINTIEAANTSLRRQHEGKVEFVKTFSAREHRRQMQRMKMHRQRKRNMRRKQLDYQRSAHEVRLERQNGNGNGS